MLETLGGGLALAAISSMFFLAYNHPTQFWKAAGYLFSVLALSWGGLLVWVVALEAAATKIYAAFDDVKLEEVEAALQPLYPPMWALFGSVPAILILIVLLAWVSTLKHDEKGKKRDAEED